MKVRLGNDVECTYVWKGIAFDGNLYISLKDITMSQAVVTFSDFAACRHLVFELDEYDSSMVETINGYSRLLFVKNDEVNNSVIIGLGREYAQIE